MNIQSVPLSSLEASRGNPRKAFNQAGIEALAASIRTDGLLQNLVVKPVGGKKKRFRIISGERRYRALKLLSERGELDESFTVPIEVREQLSSDDALRIAAVENLQRADLTPLEQMAALTKLVRGGERLDDVAAQTGLSSTTIRRRLALNSLSKDASAALAKGELNISQAEALTLAAGGLQERILEEIRRGYETINAEDIRAMALDERPTFALAIFPLEKYAGTITTDLFGEAEESYFDDAESFLKLQAEAVQALAQSYAEKADWVEITDHYRIQDWLYDAAEEGSMGGVIINMTPSGKVEVREGLARRVVNEDDAGELSENPAAPKKDKPAYSAPLCRYIAWHKSAAAQEVLLSDPTKALQLACVQALDAFKPHEAILKLADSEEPQASYKVLEAQARLYAKRLGFEIDESEAIWLQFPPFGLGECELYGAVKTLSPHELSGLHTLLTVLTFGQEGCDRLDSGDSLFNRIAADLGVDMNALWKPDRAFLEKRTKDRLLEIASEAGCTKRYGAGILRGYKKSELVLCLLRHFEQAHASEDPCEAFQMAKDWLPGVMRFPAAEIAETSKGASQVKTET